MKYKVTFRVEMKEITLTNDLFCLTDSGLQVLKAGTIIPMPYADYSKMSFEEVRDE